MLKNVIILTLSLKFDGYCIAAYDASNNEIIRLVKDTSRENGIPRPYARNIDLLDEVSINILEYCPKEHQTENVLIDLEYGLKRTGRKADIRTIYNSLQKHTYIFGNTNYKVSSIGTLDHSLEIIRFENMHIQIKTINEKTKTKASFKSNSKIHLDYSVTDARYFEEEEFIESGYSIISLPATDDFTEQYGYFKYVSAIYPD
jgi:hypothetical protein